MSSPHSAAQALDVVSEAPPARKRILEYDVLRVVAIVAVVVIHVTALALSARAQGDKGTILPLVNDAMRFAVPSFLFVSGALIWTRPFERGYAAYQGFLRRRFRVIVVPYLLWSAVYLILRYAQPTPKTPQGFEPITTDLLRSIVTGGASFQLYFVPTIVMMYMIAPLASRVMRARPAVGMVISLVGAMWVPLGINAVLGYGGTVRGLLLLLLTSMPYVAAGAWFELRRDRIMPLLRKWWPLLLPASVLVMWALSSGMLGLGGAAYQSVTIARRILGVLGFVGLGSSVLLLSRRGSGRAVTAWGEACYGVYLIHPLVLLGLGYVVTAVGLQQPWRGPAALALQVALVTGVSFGITFLLSRTRLTCWAV